jgi:hypothetical protein
MRNMLARKPVAKFRHSYVATNVTTGAWVQIIASNAQPCSAVEIFDSSGRTMKISLGAAADENAHEVPYYIIPGGSSILLPIEIAKGKRISAKAVDADATVGALVFNFFA